MFLSMILIIAFNSVINPLRTLDSKLSLNLPIHFNTKLTKLEQLQERNDWEALIIGSSRADNLLPEELKKRTGLKTFAATIPGMRMINKAIYFKAALQTYSNFKLLLYVNDCYEFAEYPLYLEPDILYQKKFQPYIQPYISKYDASYPLKFILHAISYDLTDESFEVIKKTRKDETKKELFKADGSRYIPLYRGLEIPINEKDVMEQFNRVVRNVYSGYTKLSDKKKKILFEMISIAKEKNIKVVFMMTPFNPIAYDKIKNDPELFSVYEEWRKFMNSLDDGKNILVFDFTDSTKYFPNTNYYWFDSVHYTQRAGNIFLDNIASRLSKL